MARCSLCCSLASLDRLYLPKEKSPALGNYRSEWILIVAMVVGYICNKFCIYTSLVVTCLLGFGTPKHRQFNVDRGSSAPVGVLVR